MSVTFLYENSKARALVSNAVDGSLTRQVRAAQAEHEQIEASWRERALNAEAELGRTQKEVFAQRHQIGGLMGKLRDLDQRVPGASVQALTSENITLKRRVHQDGSVRNPWRVRFLWREEPSREKAHAAESSRTGDVWLEPMATQQRPCVPAKFIRCC
ncbi:hypothetical protein [Streptomyces sp. NPDC046727]|uniref:hypothetical protein n=1 Tax=Streptomyces sp. NPDC046727 TaxID=3155373 RepID=UPI0033E4972D